MEEWSEIEEKCEGKTIRTLSANSVGMIIRFTDGSCLKYMNGTFQFGLAYAAGKGDYEQQGKRGSRREGACREAEGLRL